MEFCTVKNHQFGQNSQHKDLLDLLANFSQKESEKVLAYHKTLPGYKETPLHDMTALANKIGVQKLWIKDESKRFDLNAFKVLGSSFALARHILGENQSYRYEDAKAKGIHETVLVSATDGNHGFGLAHVGNLFGRQVKIFMPQGTEPERAERIRRLGASVDVLDKNYDECVQVAKQHAASHKGLFVQDTALDSDTQDEIKIPLYIMQGYMSILQEIFESSQDVEPSHVFLQCGVGSFASSLTALLVNKYRHSEKPPIIIGVEPNEADCFFRSCQTGKLEIVDGEMNSIMAGLCCGVPSTIAYPILRDAVSWFVSCDDVITRRGMRIMANPLPGDSCIVSGESGAVTLGLTYTLFSSDRYEYLRQEMGLNENSRILVISTEGDTNPEGYFNNIWE